MLRLAIGLLLVFGAVGTIDSDPDANLLMQVVIAVVGLVFMASAGRIEVD